MGRATTSETDPLPSAARDNDDETLVRIVEQYDEYLADQQHAIELLKQGFLKLTMAKMNLPAHAVSELSYKDEFEAALYVVDERDGSLSTIKAAQRTSAGEVDELALPSSSSTTARRREKNAEQTELATKPVLSSGAKEEDAAIMWFSSLPPANLRLAQKHFRSAVQALLVTAATARKIQRAASERSAPCIH